MGYSVVDSLQVSVILEVIVVCEDHNRVGASYEEVSPVFQASNDGQEFSFINIVVSFSRVEGLGMVSHQAFLSCFLMCLVQDCPRCKCGGIDF